jgi:hypothetical protein
MTNKPKLKLPRGALLRQIRAGLVKAPPGYMGQREIWRRERPGVEAELKQLDKQLKRERMGKARDVGFRPLGEAAKRVVDRPAG